ncbi:hypothetical protein AVEN_64894-1 [Araneus ventricosus]|uniref:Uncharacterized protein n=1 Tax=Araneus ventricosus TaxID=182803 RepID=A0A4Y2L3A0_ARAVE|nr:hypothetical protein AVEN_64894-1 [Araneus ventricosus]
MHTSSIVVCLLTCRVRLARVDAASLGIKLTQTVINYGNSSHFQLKEYVLQCTGNWKAHNLLGLWNDPARLSVCTTNQLLLADDNVSSLLSFPNRNVYLLLTTLTSYGKKMESLRKLLAGVETDEDSDLDNEDNGPEDNLEENFSNHESFSEHDTESEEDRDSGKEVNKSELFS